MIIMSFINITNEGKTRDQRRPVLKNCLLTYNVTLEEFNEWLNNNSTIDIVDPNHLFFLGYLNYSGIDTTLNSDDAFKYFKKASSYQHPAAQYYLGICYEYGIGTKEKKSNAFYWYRQAAHNGHAIAQYYIGNYFQFGVDKQYNKAFKNYQLSANGGFSFGLNMLGYCYSKGIGTFVDKSTAFNLYFKAANMDNCTAQYNVAVCFYEGIGTDEDIEKAIEWYKKSASNGYDRARIKLAGLSLLESEEKEIETKQKIIQHWNLNYGLFLDGSSIQPSKKPVLDENGNLDISVCKGEPIVYTNINNPEKSNLLDFNSKTEFNDSLKQLDLCINFPVAEITYKADFVKSFSADEEYGHIIAKKFIAGGQLFIKSFKDFPKHVQQVDILKFYLALAYNSAKNINGIKYDYFDLIRTFLPRIETSSGKEIKTPKELANWMNDLYQNNTIEIISYNNIIPISKLTNKTLTVDNVNENQLVDNINGRQPGIANYENKLKLKKWIEEESFRLIRWIEDFHLLQGFVINKLHKIENSKKISINLVGIPRVNKFDNSYFEITNPTTRLEEILISNNICSNKNIESFPFLFVKPDDFSNENNINLVVKCEKYEVLISKDNIKYPEEFHNAIEKALKSMKPFNELQNVFNEYGQLFPLKIKLGKSFKSQIATTTLFDDFEKIKLKLPIKSLEYYSKNLNISYFVTQDGNIIQEDGLVKMIKNINTEDDDLEIIELDEIISLYDILELEQKRKIDIVLNNNNRDNLKILMTGITNLKDLNDEDSEHYKQISIEPPMENENYEVFGTIVRRKNSKLEKLDQKNISINFGLYDVDGFFATIKNSEKIETDINECYVLWMIIGNPLELSIFSPINREIQVNCIKESIVIQPNKQNYNVITPFLLSEGCSILIDATTDYEFKNIIKLFEWTRNSITFQIVNLTEAQQENINMDLNIYILYSRYKSLQIDCKDEDNGVDEYSFNLFEYILTKDNFNEDKFDIDSYIDDDLYVHLNGN
ncbi:Ack1p [Rhizophagus irregularis DAOM 197198w]|uniref:Ack1p n=2 Tax=Rhizophagus irregularis TaxID=588596 RepID=A0A015LRK3_RHIIW|nr:Ack1p [Rhizophagus irregularis DAOM 197198w]